MTRRESQRRSCVRCLVAAGTHQHEAALGGLEAKDVCSDQLQSHRYVARCEDREESASSEEEEVEVQAHAAVDHPSAGDEDLQRLKHTFLGLLWVGRLDRGDIWEEEGAEDGSEDEQTECREEWSEWSHIAECQTTAYRGTLAQIPSSCVVMRNLPTKPRAPPSMVTPLNIPNILVRSSGSASAAMYEFPAS